MNVDVPAFEQVTVLPTDIGGVISVYPGFATTGKIFATPIDETDREWASLDPQTQAFVRAIAIKGVACVVIFGRIAGVILDDPSQYNEVARTMRSRLTEMALVATEHVRFVSAGTGDRLWYEMNWPLRWRLGDPTSEESAALGAGPLVAAYLRYRDFSAPVRGMPNDDELAQLMRERARRLGIVSIYDDPDGLRWPVDGRNDL